MDRFGPTGKVSKKLVHAPFEVDHFSRSDRLEFWLNGSRPGSKFANAARCNELNGNDIFLALVSVSSF